MAEKEKKESGDKKKKSAKKHLHEIRTVQAEDGSIVHHHTYKGKMEDHHTEPERMHAATSSNAEEAGQHVAEQFGMNGGGAGEEEAEAGEGMGEAKTPPSGDNNGAPETMEGE